MRKFFENRYGEPILQFRLIQIILAMIWVAVVCSLMKYPWIAAGAGALMILVYLHRLSLGRTSPLAAFVSVASAVLAGFVVGLPYLLKELKGNKPLEPLDDVEIAMFFVTILTFGLCVGTLAAVIAAIENREEWFNHLR